MPPKRAKTVNVVVHPDFLKVAGVRGTADENGSGGAAVARCETVQELARDFLGSLGVCGKNGSVSVSVQDETIRLHCPHGGKQLMVASGQIPSRTGRPNEVTSIVFVPHTNGTPGKEGEHAELLTVGDRFLRERMLEIVVNGRKLDIDRGQWEKVDQK